jgi:hypothetical protein
LDLLPAHLAAVLTPGPYRTDRRLAGRHHDLELHHYLLRRDVVEPHHCGVIGAAGAVLLLQADGKITVFRKGKVVENEPLPQVEPRHHWHDWADTCLGKPKPLWAPFDIGARITEPALLSVKATRYPGHELRWDAANYRFTNHDQANSEIVSRSYRRGFEPPEVS